MNILLWLLGSLLGITAILLLILTAYLRYRPLPIRETLLPKDLAKVSVIVPCRGWDKGLQANLVSILRQTYPLYEVIFATASANDPSLPLLKQLAAAYPNRVKIAIASPSEERADKINNQLAGLKAMDEQSQIIVFCDSDGYAHPEFLARLVAPLYQESIASTTGYRWFYFEKFTLLKALILMWGGLSLTLQSNSAFTVIWGGAMAIKTDVFEQLGVREAWAGALSDDNVLGLLLKQAQLGTTFVPSAIVLSRPEFDWRGFLYWGRRQFFFLRVSLFQDWLLTLIASTISAFGPIVLLLLLGLTLDSWLDVSLVFVGGGGIIIAFWTLAFYWAVSGGERVARQAGHTITPLPRKYFSLALMMPFIMTTQIVTSAFGRSIEWQGIVYEALAYNKTRILKDTD